MNCVIADEMMAAAEEAAVRAAVAELRRLLAVRPKPTAEPANQERKDGFEAFDLECPHR